MKHNHRDFHLIRFLKWIFNLPIKFAVRFLFAYEAFGHFLSKLLGKHYNVISCLDFVETKISQRTLQVENSSALPNGETIILHMPNSINEFRARTFFNKEPEILEWIDRFGEAGTFWDVGANVGLYSIYFAKKHPQNTVIAFEPSPFNLKLLSVNISANGLTDNVSVFPIALSDSQEFKKLSFETTTEGGAFNAFGVEYGFDGKKLQTNTAVNWWGSTGDMLLNSGILQDVPSLIKIDVDGIEHLILNGLASALSHKDCKTIYIEANPDFEEQYIEISHILTKSGFTLENEERSELLSKSTKSKSRNQIWVKN